MARLAIAVYTDLRVHTALIVVRTAHPSRVHGLALAIAESMHSRSEMVRGCDLAVGVIVAVRDNPSAVIWQSLSPRISARWSFARELG